MFRALRDPGSLAAQAGVLLLILAAIFLRQPAYFFAPQFWVEEGKVFYAQAWNESGWDTFTFLFAGYWSCYENLWALLTVWLVPLEQAPLFFKLGGLLVMLTAPIVILRSRAHHWQLPWAKSLGCLIVLVTPLNDELWLSTLGAKFYFSLTIALLLLESTGQLGRVDRIFQWAVLVMGALTSPLSSLCAPFFCLKWWGDRTPENLRRAIWLSATLAFHFVIMRLPAAGFGGRAIQHDLSVTMLAWWNKCIVLPVFGTKAADVAGNWLVFMVKQPSWWLPLLAVALLALPLLLAFAIWRKTPAPDLLLMFGAAVFIGFCSLWNALWAKHFLLYPTWAPRYTLAPGILLVLVLLHLALRTPRESRLTKAGLTLLLSLSLLGGFWDFRHARFYLSDGPSWAEECRLWRADPNHELSIWPPPFKARLNPAK
jgi:hypothetical protein